MRVCVSQKLPKDGIQAEGPISPEPQLQFWSTSETTCSNEGTVQYCALPKEMSEGVDCLGDWVDFKIDVTITTLHA